MIKELLHTKIVEHYDKATSWFQEKSQSFQFPFYSSFDLRDSSQKIAPVDANLFPAGFNNICEVDLENASSLCVDYLKTNTAFAKNIILLAEEHTHNPFYWDNIWTLKMLIEKSGILNISICVPGKTIKNNLSLKSAKGYKMKIFLLKDKISEADLIISNNDFSTDYAFDSSTPITPPQLAGWRTRRKDSFFTNYNSLAEEFGKVIGVDSEVLTIKTKRFIEFHPNDPQSLNRLEKEVEKFLNELAPLYKKLNQTPFVFLKNNSGTYGLGMTSISSAKEIESWNYKIRKKMKAAKGGQSVNELIIQEGIASDVKKQGVVAEPVIYLIGSQLAGGFLRVHKEKGTRDNLNSPGAVYRALCISDLEIEVAGKPMENVYGWIAHLGALATAYEFRKTKFI